MGGLRRILRLIADDVVWEAAPGNKAQNTPPPPSSEPFMRSPLLVNADIRTVQLVHRLTSGLPSSLEMASGGNLGRRIFSSGELRFMYQEVKSLQNQTLEYLVHV